MRPEAMPSLLEATIGLMACLGFTVRPPVHLPRITFTEPTPEMDQNLCQALSDEESRQNASLLRSYAFVLFPDDVVFPAIHEREFLYMNCRS